MEADAEFLTREQILEVFASLNSKAAGGASKNVALQTERKVGEMIWIKNIDYDDGCQDNAVKPFYVANVQKDEGDSVVCKLANGEECTEAKFNGKEFTWLKVNTMDYSKNAEKGIQDMIDIDELNHATILFNLYKRYVNNDIYTYVGPTLLAVNPFKNMDFKYPGDLIGEFKAIIDAENYFDVMKAMQPHAYAVSAYALKQMMDKKTRQGIVISGESGAGKTESAKQCMAFLTSLGSKNIDPNKAPMGERILSTNPVLEAFGNSKTARNNNSSRFGKYIKLYFDQNDGKVCGAEIKNYLLEKSRVVGCTDVERNYHAFFFMIRGMTNALAERLQYNKPDGTRKSYPDFEYLKKCNDWKVKGKETLEASDINEYNEMMKAFNNLGFTEGEIDAIHRITAASLHLGELKLDVKTFDEGKTPVSCANKDHLKFIAGLLNLDPDALLLEMVHKEAMVGIAGRTPDKPSKCVETVQALSKALFDNMFNWLVDKMNIEILPDEIKTRNPSTIATFMQTTKTVGLLDIFGFENFELNQFEQLCINYVNEKLHNLYISSVFGSEKKEMEREGIEVVLKLPKLQVLDVLKLMDNPKAETKPKIVPLGIFQTVNAPIMGEDDPVKKTKKMFDKLLKDHEPKKEVFVKEGRNTTKFRIKHSAKDVIYDAKNFIDRNADSISGTLSKLILEQSTDENVRKIYSQKAIPEIVEEDSDPKNKKRGPAPIKSIWGKFSVQITDLMNELAEPLIPKDFNPDAVKEDPKAKKKTDEEPCEPCDLHFIRCLKPNDVKVKDTFFHCMTLQQITYMGVLESIKVKQENYPYRKKHEDFYKLYELLSTEYSKGRYDLLSQSQRDQMDFKDLSDQIIKRVFAPMKPEEYSDFYKLGNRQILKMGEAKQVLDMSRSKASKTYDKYSRMIKRSYVLSKAQNELDTKMALIRKTQKRFKWKYILIQHARAKEVQKKVQAAIVAFKTFKRKDAEQDAALLIEDTFRRNKFRDKLNQAILSRQFMMRSITDLATINRCRKMWTCRLIVMKMFDNAFKIGKQKKEKESVYRIQRILRGHLERHDKQDLIENAIKSKVVLKQDVSAKKVQKKMKGLVVRRRLHYMAEMTARIQATMKMKWTRKVFLVIRKNVLILQKAYRRYMARRDQIKVRLYSYLAQELQVMENVKAMEYIQLHGNISTRQEATQMGLLKALTPYSIKKIHFFSRVIDLSILTDLSEIYQNPWSSQWIKAVRESTVSDTPIMCIQTGETHSLAVNTKGKVFTWGWNDNGQCAKDCEIQEVCLNNSSIKNAHINIDNLIEKSKQQQIQNQGGMRIKQAVTVQDRCFVLIQDTNELICWGGNNRGQLGVGHYEDVFVPTKIESLSRAGVKITYIAAGGELNLACSDKGEAFAWPSMQNGIKVSVPTRMPFSDKTCIQKVSCGHNFGFFISNQGLVYSFGEDNSDGQLGLGHIYPTELPELIQCFRDIGEKIDTVECGFKHAIAKSSLGKIYTWGSSNKGQLGHDHFDSELSPRPLYIDRKNNKKVAQIAAGYSHSMVMMDSNKEIYQFGSCGNIQDQSFPMQFDLTKHLPDLFSTMNHDQVQNQGQFENKNTGTQRQDFAIVKINCSWSKSMSVTNLLIADLRAVNKDIPHSKLALNLKTLCQSWDPKDIMPPYLEVISGLVPANIMRKPVEIKPQKKNQVLINPTNGTILKRL